MAALRRSARANPRAISAEPRYTALMNTIMRSARPGSICAVPRTVSTNAGVST